MKKLRHNRFINARNGAIVAGAAFAAAASAWDRTHRHVTRADLTETEMRVERLSDLRYEKDCLDTISGGLLREWGQFAFLGFPTLEQMLSEAGDTIFVVVERGPEGAKARGIVQTITVDVHGDPLLLQKAYPTFSALTSRAGWKRPHRSSGDTAVLLQITTLGPAERGAGLGSLLRNAVLNMLDSRVRYALTTTPVDGADAAGIRFEDATTFTPSMRFHARGGARPSRLLTGYKAPEDGAESTHGVDIVVMRYERDEAGAWPAERPAMRVRSLGPFEERILRTGRSLRMRGLKRPHPHMPPLKKPHVGLPKLDRGRDGLRRLKLRVGRQSGEDATATEA